MANAQKQEVAKKPDKSVAEIKGTEPMSALSRIDDFEHMVDDFFQGTG